MQVKLPVTASLTILIFLIGIPLATPPALASSGIPVTDPANVWYPYGPSTGNVLLHFYNGINQELQAFEQGELDLVDTFSFDAFGVPMTKWASYTSNPDFVLSPVQGSSSYFDIIFNMMSNRFRAWGCDWANGNSQCGIDMREAFAHLMDRQSLVNDGPLNGAGQALADPSHPGASPHGSPLSVQCSWDSLPQYHDNCDFAFHAGPPCPGGFCTDPSQPDFCAAVSYLIQANADSGGALGLNRDPVAPPDGFGFRCGIDPNSPGFTTIAANPVLAFIRNNDPYRLYMGSGMMNAMNVLFTRTVVSPTYGDIARARPIVFRDGVLKGAALWDWYTGGHSTAGPFADNLYPLFNSLFASDACGGPQVLSPPNNPFDCVASLDADTAAAQNSGDVSTFIAATLRAFNDFGSHALELPAYTHGERTVALKSAGGLVNQLGTGFSGFGFTGFTGYNNFYSLLSAHRGGYTPVNPIYAFGGGDPTILRYGLSGGTSELNVFNAQEENDLKVMSEIYDLLFTGSPVDPGQIFCWMCDNYQQTVDPSGNTHFTVELRQGLRWQDGTPLTAYDVKFSYMAERDYSANFGSGVAGLLLNSTSVISNTELDIVMSGVSVDWLPILSGTVIIPRSIWELKSGPGSAGTPQGYGEVGIPDLAKVYQNYDPMTAHTLIGSGPFACIDLNTGVVGGGCALTAAGTPSGQAIPAGGTMLLTRYDFTSPSGPGFTGDPFNQWIRSYNTAWGTGLGVAAHSGQFQEFRWADRFNNDTVTVRDLAQVAACSGASAPTAACPASDALGPVFAHWKKTVFETSSVIGPEVAVVAAHLDDTWVSPFSWSGDQAAQPGETLTNITPWT